MLLSSIVVSSKAENLPLCRTVQEFESERVKGAVNVPFMLRGDAGLILNAKFTGNLRILLFRFLLWW